MKILTFPGYSRTEKDDVGRLSVIGRAWALLMTACANAPSGPNAERTALVVKVYNKVKSLLQSVNDERYLRTDGGEIAFESAEIKVLTENLDKFRENVPAAQADALVWLDEAIAAAPEVPADKLALVH